MIHNTRSDSDFSHRQPSVMRIFNANALLSKTIFYLFFRSLSRERTTKVTSADSRLIYLFVFSPTVILNFFFFCQGRNYFRAIFSSRVSKIYNKASFNKASPVKWKHLSVIDREWRNKVVSSISENRVSSCY